ncbi:MAG: OmpA family protein [Roseomonas sp.]|nr:OmpA family protein [Roseomonas sp.]
MNSVRALGRIAPAAALIIGLGVAAPARAQFIEGPYVAGGLGMNYLDDAKFRLDSSLNQGMTALGQPNGGQLGFDFGGVGLLSLGWGFSNGIRLEIEGSYRSNEVDSANGAAGLASPGAHGGRQDSYGLMGNALVDLVRIGPFLPYVGIGAGYLVTSFNDLNGRPGNGSLRLRGDDTGGAFALQGIVGIGFAIDQVPGLTLTAEYRYLESLGPSIPVSYVNASGATVLSGKADTESRNQSFLLGLRYAFNAPRPMAPPAQVVHADPRYLFMVFFDWNRADLTARARRIIGEAAEGARVGPARIEVAGHADSSGAPQYNMTLSRRRAEIVAEELVRRGIARQDISITASGETKPAIITADGVREPQNRRVEIILK